MRTREFPDGSKLYTKSEKMHTQDPGYREIMNEKQQEARGSRGISTVFGYSLNAWEKEKRRGLNDEIIEATKASQAPKLRREWVALAHKIKDKHLSLAEGAPPANLICAGLEDATAREEFLRTPQFNTFSQEIAAYDSLSAEEKKTLIRHITQSFFQNEASAIQTSPDNLLWEMTRAHRESFERKRAELKEKLPALREEVAQNLYRAVDTGILPLSREKIARVHTHVDVEVVDPLVAQLEQRWGSYAANNAMIYVAYHLTSEEMMHTITHEYLHALSGHLALTLDYGFEQDEVTEWDAKSVDHGKIGLSFQGQFTWLDEAITEMLTKRIHGIEDKTLYEDEQALLKNLISYAGVDSNIWESAYFDDYDPEKKTKQERQPAWHALKNALDKTCGPRFLVHLDFFIKRNGGMPHGVEKANTLFTKHPDNFAEVLAERVTEDKENVKLLKKIFGSI